MRLIRWTGGCCLVGLALLCGAGQSAADNYETGSYYETWAGDGQAQDDSQDVYQSISDTTKSFDEFNNEGGCTSCGSGGTCSSCCGQAGCGGSCHAGCGSCSGCGLCSCDGRIFGLIAASDHCFDDFISPLSNPTFFEDPRTLTEARFIFLNHRVPSSAPVLGNSDVQLYALQVRAALTQRLSFIATKDGYINMDSDLYGHEEGWADVAAGLKYNVIRDPAA
ncbi:MAG: hypothetical protein KDA63_19530 [Planctomycetales bacterium]|nr:hypothetical protein [Planctomycetales bacterium]